MGARRGLVEQVQVEEHTSGGLRLVVVSRSGQLTWAEGARGFLEEAEWDEPRGRLLASGLSDEPRPS